VLFLWWFLCFCGEKRERVFFVVIFCVFDERIFVFLLFLCFVFVFCFYVLVFGFCCGGLF